MSSSFSFVNSVLLAVGLSLAAVFSVAAQPTEYPLVSNGSTLVFAHSDSPDAAAPLQTFPADRLRYLVEPQNSSYDPPVQGGPQSSQGSGTR